MPRVPDQDSGRGARPGRARRVRAALGLGVLMVLTAEIVARFVYGLGDPPLYDLDPQIEYLYRSSRSYRYFNTDTRINSHSMRSPEFPALKPAPDELRVMVVGDSIVAGGVRVDQAELATTLLGPMLEQTLGREVVIGNIAAGSWGPSNMLAYVERFGLFEADVVLLVLNSGDVDDVPGLSPIGRAWPTRTPLLAVQEPARYVLERYAPGMAERLGLLQPAQKIHDDPAAEASRALRTLASRVKESGAALGVLRYWQRHEMAAASAAGLDRLSTMLLDENIRCWDSAAAGPAPAPPGFTDDPRLFLPGDNAHPSAAGQARMAECLRGMVIELLDADSGSGRILGPAGLSPGPPSRRRAL